MKNSTTTVEHLETICHTAFMKRSCPTIQELLAFDSVARHESLTRAASSLCVSVSAISKQLTGLEAFIGLELLQKSGRGVRLTSAGRDYWSKISPSLRSIETATFEARSGGPSSGVLRLASAPTFLSKWLIPRLADFRKIHPGVEFSFRQHLEPNDPQPLDIDASIRYGKGEWGAVKSEYISGREFVCIAAPSVARQGRRERPARELLDQTLLHHEQAVSAWPRWAAHHGIDEVLAMSGPTFAQYSAVIQAVVSGLGVGLVPRTLVEEEIASGTACVVGKPIELDQGHYLCFAPDRLDRPVFAAFRAWILECGEHEAAASASKGSPAWAGR
ncbi:LysR substrate-binding domain-containing protein [Polaromonas sp. YR568]|uniref:LysR substrate-binding domain-containing protein n=1 Tax=Polaromonas sp. YR568 TaxID=1855301 RepID=UPI00398BD365